MSPIMSPRNPTAPDPLAHAQLDPTGELTAEAMRVRRSSKEAEAASPGRRARTFRDRRLSKDLIHDDASESDEGADDAAEATAWAMNQAQQGAGALGKGVSPASSRGAGSSLTSPETRRFSVPGANFEANAVCRRVSLQEFVQLEEEEENAGNPEPLDAVKSAIDQAMPLTPGGSFVQAGEENEVPDATPVPLTVAADSPDMEHLRGSQLSSVSSAGAMSNSDTPSRERRLKPSQQPKTAERSDGFSSSAAVTVSVEMGDVGDEGGKSSSFDPSMVGTYSCHGQEPGKEGATAVAKINQDCACLGHPFAGLAGTAMFSVYDGHGKYGHEVSQEAMHTIFHMLEESADELADNPGGTLADAFEACNIHLRLMACEPEIEVNALESGTCAVVAFLHHRKLFVASVGDCRCVLGSRIDDDTLSSLQLSTDHKVNLPGEQARIEGKGGWVRPSRIDPEDGEFVPARMYEVEGKPWLGPGLCVSRSLGDLNAMRCGLIPTPELFTHVVRPEDRFIILASDGVWEFIDNDEAVKTVDTFHQKGLPALDACRYLIARAAVCWRKFEGDYRDDITAMVVYLDDVLEKLAEEDPDTVDGASAAGGAGAPSAAAA